MLANTAMAALFPTFLGDERVVPVNVGVRLGCGS